MKSEQLPTDVLASSFTIFLECASLQGCHDFHEVPGLAVLSEVMFRSSLSFVDSLKSHHRRSFYEHHRSIAISMIVIVFLFPFAGIYVTGLFGAVSGVLLSVAAYYLTPYIWLKLNG